MERIKKQRLFLSLIALLLAVVSAALLFAVAPKRVNAEEEKAVPTVEKTKEEIRQEKEREFLELIEKTDKEELIKNAEKNRSTEITDYSSYVEITTGYFALNDFLVVYDNASNYPDGLRYCQYLGTDGWENIMFFFYQRYFGIMVDTDYTGPGAFSPMEREDLSIFYDNEVPASAFGGYYKSDTITCTMSGEYIELNTADILVPVDGLSEYGIRIFVPAQDEPTEPTEPTEPDTPTPTETVKPTTYKLPVSSDTVSSDTFIKVISAISLFALVGILFTLPHFGQTKKVKKQNKK